MTRQARGAAELERIQMEYQARSQRIPPDYYALYRDENLYFQTQISRAWLHLLRRNAFLPLSSRQIADIGCGTGQWLLELIQWGATPEHLYGIDLLPDRIASARQRLPAAAHLITGDARTLPWPDHSFDLLLQSTVFSSVLDETVRQAIAQEMRRVLRPGGHILWFDLRRSNPRNPAVCGLTQRQIAALFPGSTIQSRSTILIPPLARLVAPRSWTAALTLEKLPFACTHIAALITPRS